MGHTSPLTGPNKSEHISGLYWSLPASGFWISSFVFAFPFAIRYVSSNVRPKQMKLTSIFAIPLSLLAFILTVYFEDVEFYWEPNSYLLGVFLFLPLTIIASVAAGYLNYRSQLLPLTIILSVLSGGAICFISLIVWVTSSA